MNLANSIFEQTKVAVYDVIKANAHLSNTCLLDKIRKELNTVPTFILNTILSELAEDDN